MPDGSHSALFCQRVERTDLIADGAYMAHITRRLKWSADYKKLLKLVRDSSQFGQAFFFTVVREITSSGHDHENDAAAALRKLIQFVGYNGYSVETRWIKECEQPAPFDRHYELYTAAVNIALRLEECSRRAGHVVLMSGDVALLPAIDRAQRRGCRITVIASEADPHIADVRMQANDFVSLENLKGKIERNKRSVKGV